MLYNKLIIKEKKTKYYNKKNWSRYEMDWFEPASPLLSMSEKYGIRFVSILQIIYQKIFTIMGTILLHYSNVTVGRAVKAVSNTFSQSSGFKLQGVL